MKLCALFVLILALLFLFDTAQADVFYVHPDSTLNSIQDGIDMCSTGDTVLVGAGTYVENINFNGMAIKVMSEYGPDTTIIDGGNSAHPDTGSVVLFVSGEDANSVLQGFTLTNGTGTLDPGWGRTGGGILCDSSSPIITNNIVQGNSAYSGGAIECQYSASPIISNNTISGNIAGYAGGAMECFLNSSPEIIGNVFTQNEAQFGGAISCDSLCKSNIQYNVFTDNTHVGINSGCITCYNNAAPTIEYCAITDNDGNGILSHTSYPVINNNNIYGHGPYYGVINATPATAIDATYNWWGDPSGPGGAGPGIGDMVSIGVDYEPWLTSPGIEELKPSMPVPLVLHVSPNPFRYFTDIRYQIMDNCNDIVLEVYDITGRKVRELTTQLSVIGHQSSVKWDGRDDQNKQVPSGVFFVTLQAGDYSATEKVLLVR